MQKIINPMLSRTKMIGIAMRGSKELRWRVVEEGGYFASEISVLRSDKEFKEEGLKVRSSTEVFGVVSTLVEYNVFGLPVTTMPSLIPITPG